jgi:hypothetical protein
MSNNSFKNSSRFSSLLDDDEIVEQNNKKYKQNNIKLPNIDSEKKQNLFKMDNNNNNIIRYNSRRNNRQVNIKEEQNKPIQEFDLYKEAENFPNMISNDNNTKNSNPQNFKDILLKQNELETIEKKTFVKKGWVEIKANPNILGKIEYNYGSEKQYLNYEDEMRDFYSNNKNLTIHMNKAIEKMKIRWDKYKDDYNNEYGEGAYEELYYSTPIYGSDYDSESDLSLEDNNYNEEYYEYD